MITHIYPLYIIFHICSGDYQVIFADIGSDDDGDKPLTTAKSRGDNKGKPKSRLKECPGCGALLGTATRECLHCDYQFTSKSMLVSTQSAVEESQSIREKFPFEADRVSYIIYSFF